MRARTVVAALGLLALGFGARMSARADEVIPPPFNLQWGEPALRLEEALLGTSARIAERGKTSGGGEVWKVEGLPGIALHGVSFRLREGKLVEVELQYSKADWSAATYEAFMQSVRHRIEESHGPGNPITRQRESERGIIKTLVGHRWESAGSAIELYYFAAEDPKNVFRSVSLHYKGPASVPAGDEP